MGDWNCLIILSSNKIKSGTKKIRENFNRSHPIHLLMIRIKHILNFVKIILLCQNYWIREMRTVSFLSRVAIICNICFVLFIIFGFLERSETINAVPGTVERVPFFKEIIILLGFFAIFINFLMCLSYGILILLKKKYLIPKILAFINLAFLFLQFYYFIFLKWFMIRSWIKTNKTINSTFYVNDSIFGLYVQLIIGISRISSADRYFSSENNSGFSKPI